VPIEIDTTSLPPGQPQVAAVTLTPVGGDPEVVAIQVSVAAPQAAPGLSTSRSAPIVQVSPSRVDFGTVSREDLSAGPASLTVANLGQTTAQVRVQGAPRWLLVKPETFRLAAGARQTVKLVARIDKVRRSREQLRLKFAVDGGSDQTIEVNLNLRRRGLFR
jgi:hypothetical protein